MATGNDEESTSRNGNGAQERAEEHEKWTKWPSKRWNKKRFHI